MPHTDQSHHLPRLKLLGVGSSETRILKANVKEALHQLSLDIIVDDVERIEQLMEYDISGIPALAYGDKILFQKIVPSVEELKVIFKYLLAHIILPDEPASQTSSLKRILFPTDFSATAEQALPFAIDLANRIGSHLQLLHAYEVRKISSPFLDANHYTLEMAEHNMARWAAIIKPQLENGAKLGTKIIAGDAIPTIIAETKHLTYDLIIMGTQGANNILQMLWGTHTSSVFKNTQVPLLVIPKEAVYRSFTKIVLAVDEAPTFNNDLLKPLVTIAKSYDAIVRVYHKDETNQGLNTAVDAYLAGIDRTYHYELDPDNLLESLDLFVKEHNIDLLCMIRRPRTFLEHIFHNSATAQEVFSATVPLLLLQDFSTA